MYTSTCSNQKVHDLADQVPSLLAAWDSDLRCRFANRAHRHWFGVEPAALLGTSIRDLVGAEVFAVTEAYMRRALAGDAQSFERVVVGPDGVGRHGLVRYTPDVADGSVVGFFVEVTEIGPSTPADGTATTPTRHNLVEDLQRAASAEFKADIARRGIFLAKLAHELRNSLAPIKAGAALIAQVQSRPPHVIEKASAMVSRQVSHMAQLVNDVFDLAGIEAGVLSMTARRVDLRDIVQRALDISMPLLDEAGHSIVLSGLDGGFLPLDADPTRLTQVLSNLLNNAAKYTPRGGRVSVDVVREGTVVRVDVKDTGIGMSAGTAGSVFELFSQLNESSELRQGGLGIGLALVRQIVQAHGGTVTAFSEGPGRGSTFSVRLPLAADRRHRRDRARG